MSVKADVSSWLEFPEVIQVFDSKTNEERDYIPERVCQKIRVGTFYGRPKMGCSLCGYGLGDKRWLYCPKCGARIEDGSEK